MPIEDDLTPPAGIRLPPPHAMLVVAHSKASPGVVVGEGDGDVPSIEYEISKRAAVAALRALSNDFRVTYSHHAIAGDTHYLPLKVAEVNAAAPDVAVEMHCNSGPPTADYREVIYWPGSARGKRAAEHVAAALNDKFHGERICKARPNTVAFDKHDLYFLARTTAPALIVEGFFLTNPRHRGLLSASGGAEDYGLAVAAGLRSYLDEIRGKGGATSGEPA